MPDLWVPVLGGRPLSAGDLKEAATAMLQDCQAIKVWLFNGDLGAGKTTFIKSIGEALGVESTMSSPTFSIINEYRTTGGAKIYHFDFYRMKDEREAFDIGTDEYFDSGNYCFVEWPDRIPSLIPDERVEVNIRPGTDPEVRFIAYAKHE